MSQERNSNRKADAVGAVISRFLQDRGLETKLRRYRAWQVWEQVVGPQIAARARPALMRDDILEIRVDHPVWMQQLQLMKPKIIARLNAAIGEPLIKDLYLRRGRPETGFAPNAGMSPEPRWRTVALSPEESARIEQTVAAVADPELRRHLQELFSRQTRLAKSRQKEEA
jgi:hypothetical protein